MNASITMTAQELVNLIKKDIYEKTGYDVHNIKVVHVVETSEPVMEYDRTKNMIRFREGTIDIATGSMNSRSGVDKPPAT
jgi:hypothetical protein